MKLSVHGLCSCFNSDVTLFLLIFNSILPLAFRNSLDSYSLCPFLSYNVGHSVTHTCAHVHTHTHTRPFDCRPLSKMVLFLFKSHSLQSSVDKMKGHLGNPLELRCLTWTSSSISLHLFFLLKRRGYIVPLLQSVVRSKWNNLCNPPEQWLKHGGKS